jgi:hypothetical protein
MRSLFICFVVVIWILFSSVDSAHNGKFILNIKKRISRIVSKIQKDINSKIEKAIERAELEAEIESEIEGEAEEAEVETEAGIFGNTTPKYSVLGGRGLTLRNI